MLETLVIWGLLTFAGSVLIRILTADEKLRGPPDPDRCPHCGARIAPGVLFPATACRRCGTRLGPGRQPPG